ncbi:unnamed protein product [Penicillium pancosmium]
MSLLGGALFLSISVKRQVHNRHLDGISTGIYCAFNPSKWAGPIHIVARRSLFSGFLSLEDVLPEEEDTPSLKHKVQEDLGRFRIWGGNYGANRKQTDRLSLDHRLREAPELHQEVTAHLNDLSDSIQSARRDRMTQASRIDLHHFQYFDIQHVSDKFNLPIDSKLARRLGEANTRRRQLLAYYRSHTDKIAKYVDVAIDKATENINRPFEIDDIGLFSQKAPTISSKWTQDTTASTIHQQDTEVASDSGKTTFSTTTSSMNDQYQASIPPLPSKSLTKGPFSCPYCRQMIQLENESDWVYHVHSDLKPYICTLGDCTKSNQLYDSYTEWSGHERQFHRREWFCHVCSDTFETESSFSDHLQKLHIEYEDL